MAALALPQQGQLAFDEYGRPIIIFKEQEKKKRLKGIDAHKVIKIKLIHPSVLFLSLVVTYIGSQSSSWYFEIVSRSQGPR